MSLPKNAGESLSAAEVNQLGPFGSFVSKADATVYQAATDGFVIAEVYSNGAVAAVYVDTFNPPTTLRMRARPYSSGYYITMTCPVPRGHYWKTTGCSAVTWFPIGS